MSMAERLPTMNDKDLVSLRDNAKRLSKVAGSEKQRLMAEELLPLVNKEIKSRLAEKPVKGVKKTTLKAKDAGEEPKAKKPRAPAKPKVAKADKAAQQAA